MSPARDLPLLGFPKCMTGPHHWPAVLAGLRCPFIDISSSWFARPDPRPRGPERPTRGRFSGTGGVMNTIPIPRGDRLPRLPRSPPVPFLTTSMAQSSSGLAGLLHPAANPGVREVSPRTPADSRPDGDQTISSAILEHSRVPPHELYPSEVSPRIWPSDFRADEQHSVIGGTPHRGRTNTVVLNPAHVHGLPSLLAVGSALLSRVGPLRLSAQ
jgi:hypothetical protein